MIIRCHERKHCEKIEDIGDVPFLNVCKMEMMLEVVVQTENICHFMKAICLVCPVLYHHHPLTVESAQ